MIGDGQFIIILLLYDVCITSYTQVFIRFHQIN